jgi:hypothetical protein
MNNLETKINSLLTEADIEGYISLGAPSDEYAQEAKNIAAAIRALPQEQRNLQYILAIIVNEWMDSFGLSEKDIVQRHDALESVARNLV